MLGLATTAASIDSHVIHKELSELDNYADLDVWFDFSRTHGNQGDEISSFSNLGQMSTSTKDFVDGTCDYNNDPTITVDSTVRLAAGMGVQGTGIPEGATIDSINDATTFELSEATTGGSVTNGELTFTTTITSYDIIANGGTPSLDFHRMGKRAISFDGTNDTLNMKAAYATSAKPLTLLIVLNCTNISAGNDYVLTDNAEDDDAVAIRIMNGGGSITTKWSSSHASTTSTISTTAGTTTAYTIADATNVALVFRRDSDGKTFIYADSSGIIAKKSNANNDNPVDYTLGSIGGSSESSADFTGYIGEIALYDADLGEAKILTMLEEMSKKWGINQ